MEIQNYLKEMKILHQELLSFFDTDDYNENYQMLVQIIREQNILENQHKLKTMLYILSQLTSDHHRTAKFNEKIALIFSLLKDSLLKFFTNEELVRIFKQNKRVLLELFEQKITYIDEKIPPIIIDYEMFNDNIEQYFFPEIQQFLDPEELEEIAKDIPEKLEENRKIGESENYICKLIRNDSVEEFINYQAQTNFDFISNIEISVFETNFFLIKRDPTLIEYAAFYGSIKIFRYLQNKGAELTPAMWLYAIHGRKSEIFQILRENGIQPKMKKFDHTIEVNSDTELDAEVSYLPCLEEAIKCHHNELVDFLQTNNLCQISSSDFLQLVLKYYDFEYIENSDICKELLYSLCHYDYYILVEALLSQNDIDINALTV